MILAERMASLAFSVVYRSSARLLIGKTYWKSVLQPRMINASSVVVWSRQEKAPTVEGRDRKIKLGFRRYMFKTGNGLMKAIFQRMCGERRPERWVREYMGELEISFDRLESMTKLELDRVVDRW